MPIKPRSLIRKLRRIGVTVGSEKKASGHMTARRGKRKTGIPVHGGGYEISDPLLDIIFCQFV